MSIILIADDERNQRIALGIIVRGEGHEVIEAADGDEAIKIIRGSTSGDIAMVITDYNMPGAKGDQVAREAAIAGIPRIIINSCYARHVPAIEGVIVSEKMNQGAVERLVLKPLREET